VPPQASPSTPGPMQRRVKGLQDSDSAGSESQKLEKKSQCAFRRGEPSHLSELVLQWRP
jgi:hypothetical protein